MKTKVYCIFMVFSMLAAMLSSCVGIGSGSLLGDDASSDDTTEPVEVFEGEYLTIIDDIEPLPVDMLDGVNSAFMAVTEENSPFAESGEDLCNVREGRIYLGGFGEYYIFMYAPPTALCWGGRVELDGHIFSWGRPFWLYAYKDGEMTYLSDIYNEGKITYPELCEIHDRFIQAYIYGYVFLNNNSGTLTVSRETIPDGVKVPILLPATEEKLQDAAADYLNKQNPDADVNADDIYVKEYYGEYDGAHVFYVQHPGAEYENGYCGFESVNGVNIMYAMQNTGTLIMVYDGEIIYRLGEAFDAGLLKEKDIVEIKKLNTLYYSYVLEEYCKDTPHRYAYPIK